MYRHHGQQHDLGFARIGLCDGYRPPHSTRNEIVDNDIEGTADMIQRASMSAGPAIARADREIGPFFVWWDNVTLAEAAALRRAVENAKNEHEIQSFLNVNRSSLIQHLGGGHGRWVIPKKKLGAEYETDFVIGQKSSAGYEWMAVELESPRAHVFTKGGDFTAAANHAIRQITDWRVWLRSNMSYAEKPRSDNGLGLLNIDSELPGLILMGRRDDGRDRPAKRRYLKSRLGIEIHSYDWLIDLSQAKAEALARGADAERQLLDELSRQDHTPKD